MDVDKLLNSNTECLTPSKKAKLKEKKEEIASFQIEYLMSSRREVAFLYETFSLKLNCLGFPSTAFI